jgi:hypothetical protein
LPDEGLVQLKKSCAEHANTRLNFNENMAELERCIGAIKFTPLNDDLIAMVNKMDKKNYHIFLKAQPFFRLLFSCYKHFKKLSR